MQINVKIFISLIHKVCRCGMAAEKNDPSFVRILISYKEYQRLKTIENQFKQSEQKIQQKLQLAGALYY